MGIAGKDGHCRQRCIAGQQTDALRIGSGITDRDGFYMQRGTLQAERGIKGREGHRRQIVPRRQRWAARRERHYRLRRELHAEKGNTGREGHYMQRGALQAARRIKGLEGHYSESREGPGPKELDSRR
jgi:hypothetical protein